MNRVYDFLKKAETYYLATVDGDQPMVRPFETVNIFEDKLYIQTGKDGNTVVYYLMDATATISAFSHAPALNSHNRLHGKLKLRV